MPEILDFPKNDSTKQIKLVMTKAASIPAKASLVPDAAACVAASPLLAASSFAVSLSPAIAAAQTVAQRMFGILAAKAMIPRIQGALDLCCCVVTVTFTLSFPMTVSFPMLFFVFAPCKDCIVPLMNTLKNPMLSLKLFAPHV